MTPSPVHPGSHKRPLPARLAAVRRDGGQWHVVVARTDGPGVSVVHAVTAPNAEAVDALLREHRVGGVVAVIPAGETICRPASIPPSPSPAAAAEALALLAEAELPAAIPAHRRAGGIVPALNDESPAIPLLVAWPQRVADAEQGADEPETRPLAWVPELVCLAALARATGGCTLAVRADRASGAVAIVAAGPGRAAARVLRADTSSDQAWTAAVAEAAERTAQAVGAAAQGVRGDAALQLLGPAGEVAPTSVSGVRADAAWLAAYGAGVGAILALTTADEAGAPLLSMRPEAEEDVSGPLGRTLAWLSAPVRAGAVLAACAASLLFVLLGVAAARASVLERRAAGQTPLEERLAAADREVAFYDLLRARRWPMTKLLADIAGAAPVGVRLDSIDLAPEGGSAASGLVVRGTASSADVVTEFTKNLSDTRIFADVATPSIAPESGGDGVTFQLQARIAAPLFRARPAADFAEQTLAQRLYGDRAAEAGRADTEPDDRDGERRRARGGERSAGTSARAEPSSAPAEAPPALSDDEIAAMDRPTLVREFGARRLAMAKQSPGSPERQRLEAEVEKLRTRLAETSGGGGGS